MLPEPSGPLSRRLDAEVSRAFPHTTLIRSEARREATPEQCIPSWFPRTGLWCCTTLQFARNARYRMWFTG